MDFVKILFFPSHSWGNKARKKNISEKQSIVINIISYIIVPHLKAGLASYKDNINHKVKAPHHDSGHVMKAINNRKSLKIGNLLVIRKNTRVRKTLARWNKLVCSIPSLVLSVINYYRVSSKKTIFAGPIISQETAFI